MCELPYMLEYIVIILGTYFFVLIIILSYAVAIISCMFECFCLRTFTALFL